MSTLTETAVDLVAAARDGLDQPDGPNRFALLDQVIGEARPGAAEVRLVAVLAAAFVRPAAEHHGRSVADLLSHLSASAGVTQPASADAASSPEPRPAPPGLDRQTPR